MLFITSLKIIFYQANLFIFRSLYLIMEEFDVCYFFTQKCPTSTYI
jgi:hypothetical protein